MYKKGAIQMKPIKKVVLTVSGVMIFSLSGFGGQFTLAESGEVDSFTEQMQVWEEQGVDPNHTEVTENIMDYIDENIEDDVFVSMHIDREQRDLGVLVFSFIEQISEEAKQDIKNLVEEPAEIELREVTYTESELTKKQEEIDLSEFEDRGITIHHTGVDVINNQVDVGILPFNEENAQIIYDEYGAEMVQVVEGVDAQLLDVSTRDENAKQVKTEDNKNVFQTFFLSIRNWFNNLF